MFNSCWCSRVKFINTCTTFSVEKLSSTTLVQKEVLHVSWYPIFYEKCLTHAGVVELSLSTLVQRLVLRNLALLHLSRWKCYMYHGTLFSMKNV